MGVVDSPTLRDEVNSDLDFQESNLLLLALRVILEMNVGFEAVVGVDSRLPTVPGTDERPDGVRSSDSRDSAVDMVGAIEWVSFDFRESGGEPETVYSSLILALSLSLSFSLVLSLFLPKPNMLNAGALGLSLGVDGRFGC